MKAFILAAGLGTRLKPWTTEHPKALVPVRGIPMLERVISTLRRQGFDDITVNIHHFGNQIIDFLNNHEIGNGVKISDERNRLLDTGGGILNAEPALTENREPFLIHNVDILSNADLRDLMHNHIESHAGATLLVSNRKSSRHLVFSPDMKLRGWHAINDDTFRPEGFSPNPDDIEFAFSGIHVMSVDVFAEMRRLQYQNAFPIMDFYLNPSNKLLLRGYKEASLRLIDIGKPETLNEANTADELLDIL